MSSGSGSGGGKQQLYNTRSKTSSQDHTDNLTMDDKLDLLLKEVRLIKDSNQACLSEITAIKSDIQTFKEEIGATVDNCFQHVEECKQLIKVNSGAISESAESIDLIKNENVKLRREVAELKRREAAADQYSRSNCLEITGVPESSSENIVHTVKLVAKALNFNLEDGMIDAVHRLSKNPNKPSEPRGIILKFCRRMDMEEMRRKSRVKKSFHATELGFNSDSVVYVNLSLTKATRELWKAVQAFKKRSGYKYAWMTSVGKIFLRRDQGQPAIMITSSEDLNGLK
jgi:hypothetical protein